MPLNIILWRTPFHCILFSHGKINISTWRTHQETQSIFIPQDYRWKGGLNTMNSSISYVSLVGIHRLWETLKYMITPLSIWSFPSYPCYIAEWEQIWQLVGAHRSDGPPPRVRRQIMCRRAVSVQMLQWRGVLKELLSLEMPLCSMGGGEMPFPPPTPTHQCLR